MVSVGSLSIKSWVIYVVHAIEEVGNYLEKIIDPIPIIINGD
jgi:hypothetical protein